MPGPERVYNIQEVIAEARLTKPAIVLTGFPNDAKARFTIDPPELWSDETSAIIAAGDPETCCRALLRERYDEFIAAGGSNMVVNLVMEKHARPAGGLGES